MADKDLFSKYPTLRWNAGKLEMLDQRVLPTRVDYLRYDSAVSVAEGIKTMVVRGAPAIGCAAAYGVALEALRLRDQSHDAFFAGMRQGMTALAASRPTAVNLFWALNRMRVKLDSLRTAGVSDIANALLAEAHTITEEDVRLNRAMGAHGALTHALQRRRTCHGGPRHGAGRHSFRRRIRKAHPCLCR